MSEDEWLKRGSIDSDDVRGYYDKFAETYDDKLAEWNYRAPEEVAALLAASAENAAAILDIGCGTGLSGAALKEAGFIGRIDGCDLSPDSVEMARRRGVYHSVFEANLQALPLSIDANTYDAAVCVGVLTYVADPEAVLREFCRITRPGGTIVFTHREDLVREQDYDGLTKRMEDEGLWTRKVMTEPQPYIPGNADFADEIGVVYFAFHVK